MMTEKLLPALLICLCSLASPAAAHAQAQPVAPLSAEHARVLRSVPEDPAPEGLFSDTHYLISNEDRPERFRGAVSDLGGLQLGVGTDQNYLFAGWARPQVLALIDFDQQVVDLHRVYR